MPAARLRFTTGNKKKLKIKVKIFDLQNGLLYKAEERASNWHSQLQKASEEAFESPTFIDYVHEQVNREIKLPQNPQVLELGAGKGKLLATLLLRGATVTAVDFLEKATNFLRQKFASQARSRQLIIGNHEFTELPKTALWKAEQMDLAVSTFSSENHPYPQALFKTVKAALKKGGTFVIAEATPFHENLVSHIQAAGLEVEKVSVIPIPTSGNNPTYCTIVRARKK